MDNTSLGELKNTGLLQGDIAPIENPVDAGAPLAPLETVKCSGIGGRQNITDSKAALFGSGLGIGEHRVAGGMRCTVEISAQNNRPVDGPGEDVGLDDVRAGDLNGCVKVQMGCGADSTSGRKIALAWGRS